MRRLRRGIFPSPKAHIKGNSEFFKSQRLYEGGARNVPKSQDPYRYRSAKSNILTYFFIFFMYSFIFSTYSFIILHIFHILFLHIYFRYIPSYFRLLSSYFSHIPSYFLLIYYIKELPNVTSLRGRGVYSQILKLPLRSKAGNFSKSPGHFFECDVIRGGCTHKS